MAPNCLLITKAGGFGSGWDRVFSCNLSVPCRRNKVALQRGICAAPQAGGSPGPAQGTRAVPGAKAAACSGPPRSTRGRRTPPGRSPLQICVFLHLNLEIEKPGLAPSPWRSAAAPEGACGAERRRVPELAGSEGGRKRLRPGLARGAGRRRQLPAAYLLGKRDKPPALPAPLRLASAPMALSLQPP